MSEITKNGIERFVERLSEAARMELIARWHDVESLKKIVRRIERLEAENADLRSGSYLASVVEERDRLRKALDEIANGPWFADKSYPVLFAHLTAKAREALEAKP